MLCTLIMGAKLMWKVTTIKTRHSIGSRSVCPTIAGRFMQEYASTNTQNAKVIYR